MFWDICRWQRVLIMDTKEPGVDLFSSRYTVYTIGHIDWIPSTGVNYSTHMVHWIYVIASNHANTELSNIVVVIVPHPFQRKNGGLWNCLRSSIHSSGENFADDVTQHHWANSLQIKFIGAVLACRCATSCSFACQALGTLFMGWGTLRWYACYKYHDDNDYDPSEVRKLMRDLTELIVA